MIQTSFFKEEEIFIDLNGLKPIKVEEIDYRNCIDIEPDTYMLYPSGGFHLFYRIPNTFSRYQLPIWPYVKRIKGGYSKKIVSSRYNIKRGYINISMPTKRGIDNFDLHGLVARAYVPNPNNKPLVLHKNDDPTNYLPENLKWGTASENMMGVTQNIQGKQQMYLDLVNKGYVKG